MDWATVRKRYPDKWLVVEAELAHTSAEGQRHVDGVRVIEECPDGATAFDRYRHHHNARPQRELYYVHTSRPRLVIQEEHWLGLRTVSEA